MPKEKTVMTFRCCSRYKGMVRLTINVKHYANDKSTAL